MENYAYGFVNSLYTVAADQPTDAERKESSREPTNSQRAPEQCESDRESETEGKCQWFELRQYILAHFNTDIIGILF